MLRQILIYGVIGGLIVAVPMLFGVQMSIPAPYSELVGYSIMLVAFSTIFIAVKQYRDSVLGGVIKFLPALGIGLGISVVAGLFYAGAWEIIMAQNPGMMDGYFASAIAKAQASGKSAAEIQAAVAETEQMKAAYSNPLFRMAFSFGLEILPVGVIVSLISAVLLRNSRFLPARAAA